MLIGLMILTSFLLFYFFLVEETRYSLGIYSAIRISLIKTLILISFFSYFFAEINSIFQSLSFVSMIFCWSFFILVISFLCFYIYRNNKVKFIMDGYISISQRIYLVVIFIFILIPLFVLALIVPPNNWDSMTYHMPRVMHWIQNLNIYPYPTGNVRQLVTPPLAEYIILNMQLLSGDDYFANLVQFFSMIGTICAISLFVKEFSLNYRGQVFSILLILSIPLGIFQSTTTQTDYIASFFYISFLYFAFLTINRRDNIFKNVLFMSLCLWLGGLSKYNTLIFALPICLYLGVFWLKNYDLRHIFSFAFIISFTFVVILSPFLIRNQKYFQSPLGDPAIAIIMKNDEPSIKNMVSNASKNVSDHLTLPFAFYNKTLQALVSEFHKLLDVSPNSPANNFGNYNYQVSFSFTEDKASSPIHVIFFIISGLFLYMNKLSPQRKWLLLLYLSVIFSGLLHSLIFRWQPWGERLLLPVTLTSVVLVSSIIFPIISKSRNILTSLSVFLLFYGMIPVYFNRNKPIIDPIAIVRKLKKEPKGTLTQDIIDTHIPKAILPSILLNYHLTEDGLKLRNDLTELQKIELYNIEDSLGFFNAERRIILFNSRTENYFITQPYLLTKLRAVLDSIPTVDNKVALNLGVEAFEYPLWILAKEKFNQGFSFHTPIEDGKLVNLYPEINQHLDSEFNIEISELNNSWTVKRSKASYVGIK
jgi:hypothetical protein